MEEMSLTPREKKSRKPSRWLQIFTVSLDRIKILQHKRESKNICRSKYRTHIHNATSLYTHSKSHLHYVMIMLMFEFVCRNVTHFIINTVRQTIKKNLSPNLTPPLQAEFGGQVSSVSICDVRVFFEEEGDLFVGVQSYPLGCEHRPVLVAAQLYVVGSFQQLLGHL